MGLGIVCVDLRSEHQPVLSSIMLWLASGAWIFLALVLTLRIVRERTRVERDCTSPAALTGVAGTAVLGTAFAVHDYRQAAAALLALASLGWALLVLPVLRHWTWPTTGGSFVLTVATEGLAVLGATLAATEQARWLLIAAVAALVLGLAFYLCTVSRFDRRQFLSGRGDHWVAGGALAISALASVKVSEAARVQGWAYAQREALDIASLALWCIAILLLVCLLAGEVLRPRLGSAVSRWATVFPLGMYAACSFAVGEANGISAISAFGRAWTWLAFAASLVALAWLWRCGWRVLCRRDPRPDTRAPA